MCSLRPLGLLRDNFLVVRCRLLLKIVELSEYFNASHSTYGRCGVFFDHAQNFIARARGRKSPLFSLNHFCSRVFP